MRAIHEPEGAFVCRPPDEHILSDYSQLFALEGPLPDRKLKSAFDKLGSALGLILAAPVFAGLSLAGLIEGTLIPKNRGPLVYSYKACSGGRTFDKYKIRTIKTQYVDSELAARGSWHAYAAEWNPDALTYTGRLVKALYLDELPQLYNIFRGDMSFVGPRPLALHHYQRDLAQGNVNRKLLKAGLLGPGQALKGTEDFGRANPEYEYVQAHLTLSGPALAWLDVKLIARGLWVVCRARGL